jgi:hypothetical protein
VVTDAPEAPRLASVSADPYTVGAVAGETRRRGGHAGAIPQLRRTGVRAVSATLPRLVTASLIRRLAHQAASTALTSAARRG